MYDKPSHENQAGRSHQEPAEKKQFCPWEQEAEPQSTFPFFPPDMSEPKITDISDIKVHTTVPFFPGGDTQDDTVKQSLTLAMIAERYPQEAWIHVFTDGSATNAVTNGGAGILVYFPGGQKASASMAVGKHCFLPSPFCRHIKTTSSKTWPKPYSKLQLPGWIPAHSGISGNEQVDILARKGARGEQHNNSVSFSEKKTLIRAHTMPRSQRDDYHLLSCPIKLRPPPLLCDPIQSFQESLLKPWL